jgi:hypothetical protein
MTERLSVNQCCSGVGGAQVPRDEDNRSRDDEAVSVLKLIVLLYSAISARDNNCIVLAHD